MPYACPQCGAQNPDTAQFCYNCGAANPSAAGTIPMASVGKPPDGPSNPYAPQQPPSYGGTPPAGGAASNPYGQSSSPYGQGPNPYGQPSNPSASPYAPPPQSQPPYASNPYAAPSYPQPPAAQPYSAAPVYGQVGYGAMGAENFSPEVMALQSKARTSLICGIIGFLCFGIILGPIAFISGFKSRSKLSQLGVSQGQGMALAGMILGVVDVLFFFVFIVLRLALSS
jgi:hypothetical protein